MAFNQLLWILHGKVLNKFPEEDSSKKYEDLAPGGIFPKSTKVYIEKIEAILSEYRLLQEFIDSSTGWVTPGSVKGKANGLYLEAFCNGVSSELMSMNHIFKDVEENMLSDSSISMLEILNKFEYVVNVLSSLNLSVRKVRQGNYHGCTILNLCDNLICSGSSLNATVFRRVQKCCLKQFYKQTKLWINQAVLYDPFNEFFICLAEESQTTFDSSVSMSTIRTVASIASSTSRYKVNPDNLPSIIPCSVALKMLFIGEALTICQHNEGGSKTNDQILSACGISKQSIASQLNEIEKKDYFSLREFSVLIDQLWVGVNKYIWQICVEIGNVRNQLVLMRDIYLLGRGELFQEFLLKGSSLLSRDVTNTNGNDLNRAFKDAVYYVYLTETSELTDQFFFKLPNRKALMQGFTVWSVMQLECKIKWPLQCLFTTDIMKIYNKLFCFLLKLKKAHMDITSTSTWKSINCIRDRKLMMELIDVRMCLRAIVGNFQNYCFTNVIANEMTLFMESLKNTVMFTDLQKSLSIVLNNIKSRLFIPEVSSSSDRTCDKSINSYPKVHKWFKAIFTLCRSFSELIEKEDSRTLSKVTDIKNELQVVLKKLFSLLQEIDDNYYYEDSNSTTHLYSLLMCLDYTGFFRNKFHLNKCD